MSTAGKENSRGGSAGTSATRDVGAGSAAGTEASTIKASADTSGAGGLSNCEVLTGGGRGSDSSVSLAQPVIFS